MSETYQTPPPPPGLEYAGWGRRIAAIFLDFAACSLIVTGFAGGNYSHQSSTVWLPSLIFIVEAGLGTALAGGSFGQLALRIRVLRLDGRPLSLLAALGRAVLICLVIPPLVFRPDGRGLHDMAFGSGVFLRTPASRPRG